jgi:hypothetical protein
VKPKVQPPYDFIFLEWLDATRLTDWQKADDVEQYLKDDSTGLVREGGFVLCETDRYLVISANIGDSLNDRVEPQFNGVSRIPKTWIRKRITLLTIDEHGTITRHAQRSRSRKSRNAGGR